MRRLHFTQSSWIIYFRSFLGYISWVYCSFQEKLNPWINQPKKLVLCMPGGGLNDVLCITLLFYQYSLRNSRTLFIGSKYSSVGSLKSLFSGWPQSIKFIDEKYENLIENASTIFPPQAKKYIQQCGSDLGFDQSDQTPVHITFNTSKAYPDSLLVHVGRGGGFGFDLLRHLQLKEPYRTSVIQTIQRLPHTYDSVQIRNTDIQTDWQILLEQLGRQSTSLPLLVCSDSDLVLQTFKDRLSKIRPVISLRSFCKDYQSTPLHYAKTKSQLQKNTEMFADLFSMAFSRKLYLAASAQGISGFPRLALALHLHQQTALKILGCSFKDLYR
ncbi:hypothetical protein [Synechococcus elongatus]|uniref:Uncharacterized protein n=1 Tax=Synechococcus elongatus PCC 11802 TaxID=2283154 RepID=A0AAT9JZI6_SYNEL|nr:hypothetical protein [Synechococcus elongatus]QFZ91308.1 hypothetical protein EKO22_01930 [Synechococcus elongatus PCC 11802]